jgi:hypothetical protein
MMVVKPQAFLTSALDGKERATALFDHFAHGKSFTGTHRGLSNTTADTDVANKWFDVARMLQLHLPVRVTEVRTCLVVG